MNIQNPPGRQIWKRHFHNIRFFHSTSVCSASTWCQALCSMLGVRRTCSLPHGAPRLTGDRCTGNRHTVDGEFHILSTSGLDGRPHSPFLNKLSRSPFSCLCASHLFYLIICIRSSTHSVFQPICIAVSILELQTAPTSNKS